jgi:putative nucleotidyltransferase with HDIG domain
MNPAVAFMISLGQCLATMSLYPSGHPARERVIDQSFARLLEVLGNIQFAEFSILEGGVVFQGRVLEELRSWDWTSRLAGTGIERIEIDADVTREGWDDALDAMWQQLNGKSPESNDARQQLTASAVRFGSLRVMGGNAEAQGGAAAAGPAADAPSEADVQDEAPTMVVSLSEEISTVNWLHEEVLTGAKIPMAEVEAIVGSMAVAMRANEKLLLPMVMMKEFDEYTTTHACNVSMLSMGLAEALGCSRSETRAFGVAGLLHDIGKVKIPKDILNKPGRLTDDEREVMAAHPEEGARILLEREKGMQMAAVVAYEHHICIDGKGYPRMHFERGCHMASRLVHVCDIYDALSTNRPYRKPWTVEQVLNYIEERAGTEVDPEISRTFAGMVRGSTIGHVPMPTKDAISS